MTDALDTYLKAKAGHTFFPTGCLIGPGDLSKKIFNENDRKRQVSKFFTKFFPKFLLELIIKIFHFLLFKLAPSFSWPLLVTWVLILNSVIIIFPARLESYSEWVLN